jgi:hypothetical protein
LRRGRDRQQYTTLPAGPDPSFSSAAPSWASIVRDGVSATSPLLLPQAALSPKEDLFRLYELFIANGLTPRVAICSATGTLEITLSAISELYQPTSPLQSHRCHRRQCHRCWNRTMGNVANHVAAAMPAPTAPPFSEPSPPKPSWPEHSPPTAFLPKSAIRCGARHTQQAKRAPGPITQKTYIADPTDRMGLNSETDQKG